MTLDQLRVFVAVAQRQHLTRGAEAVHLSPSAATAAIQALEGRHGVKLFHRVARRLELTGIGRAFLPQAQAALGAAAQAENALRELGALPSGQLVVAASQTIASHWLPPILVHFAALHESVSLCLVEGNTEKTAMAVLAGDAEIGCVEGEVDEPALAVKTLVEDRLVIVGAPQHPLTRRRPVAASELDRARWVMREPGSGTRSAFEAAMRAAGLNADALSVTLTLPSNEAVCAAVAQSHCLTVVSEIVALPYLQSGRLRGVDYALPARRFTLIRHKQRFRTKASLAFEALLFSQADEMARRRLPPEYDI